MSAVIGRPSGLLAQGNTARSAHAARRPHGSAVRRLKRSDAPLNMHLSAHASILRAPSRKPYHHSHHMGFMRTHSTSHGVAATGLRKSECAIRSESFHTRVELSQCA